MDMIKVETQALSGDALNWAVMKSEGVELLPVIKDGAFMGWLSADDKMPWPGKVMDFVNDWNLVKRLVKKHSITLNNMPDGSWVTSVQRDGQPEWSYDVDPGVAFCKAALTLVLGDIIEVPAILIDQAAQDVKG